MHNDRQVNVRLPSQDATTLKEIAALMETSEAAVIAYAVMLLDRKIRSLANQTDRPTAREMQSYPVMLHAVRDLKYKIHEYRYTRQE